MQLQNKPSYKPQETTLCDLLKKNTLLLALAGLAAISLIAYAIAEIVILIYSVVVLLQGDMCLNCDYPLYTWLTMAVVIQLTRLVSRDLVLHFTSLCASLELLSYAVRYYSNRHTCLLEDSGTQVFFNLVVAHVILLSIWYVIVAIGVVLFAIAIQSTQNSYVKLDYSFGLFNVFTMLFTIPRQWLNRDYEVIS